MKKCNQCEIMYINGMRCHEHRCSEAYKDEIRACKWCGSGFTPGYEDDQYCSEDCLECYNS